MVVRLISLWLCLAVAPVAVYGFVGSTRGSPQLGNMDLAAVLVAVGVGVRLHSDRHLFLSLTG